MQSSVEQNVDASPVVVELGETTEVLARVEGSFWQSYILDTCVAHLARTSVVVLSIPLIFMRELHPGLKCLVVVSPQIANLLVHIPMAWRINKTGGKRESLVMVTAASLGMTTLTVLFACTDMSTVHRFDWRYALMLASGFLIGLGTSTVQMISDVLKWAPSKASIPNFQLLYAFLVDISGVITPKITYFLGKDGFFIPFSMYTGLFAAAGVYSCAGLEPSPYYQFKRQHSKEVARRLAVEAGELNEFIKDDDDVELSSLLRDNLTVLYDRRCLLLAFSLFSALGSFFISKTVLPNLLINGFGFSNEEAVITASLATLATVGTRPIASKAIVYLDSKSAGVRLHVFGCVLTLIGTTTLATVNPIPRWALYTSLIVSNIGYGILMTTLQNIARDWSTKPKNENLKEINPSLMFGLISTIAVLGAILLPFLLTMLVGNVEKWYIPYFSALTVMTGFSAISVPIVHYQVKTSNARTFLNRASSFFGHIFNVRGNTHAMVMDEPVAREPLAQEEDEEETAVLEMLF